MIATQITNHIQLALGRLMQEYVQVADSFTLTPLSGGPLIDVSAFDAVLVSFVDQLQLLENAIYTIDGSRQLWNGSFTPAIGAQLDALGVLVGVSRAGRSDTEYLTFIFGQIAEDNSNASLPTIGSIAALLFSVTTLILGELYPASVYLEIPSSTTLPASQYLAAVHIIAAALGAGISLLYAATYPPNPFRFTTIGGPVLGGGFGDLNNPLIGGGFASLIYSNMSGD